VPALPSIRGIHTKHGASYRQRHPLSKAIPSEKLTASGARVSLISDSMNAPKPVVYLGFLRLRQSLRPFPLRIAFVRKHQGHPSVWRTIPSDSPGASGADPSRRNTRSRSIASPPAAPYVWWPRVPALSFRCVVLRKQERPTISSLHRNQSRGSRRSPAPGRCGACLLVPTRSSSIDGYPSPFKAMRIEKEQPSRTGKEGVQ